MDEYSFSIQEKTINGLSWIFDYTFKLSPFGKSGGPGTPTGISWCK